MDIQPTQRTLAPTLKSHPQKKKKKQTKPLQNPSIKHKQQAQNSTQGT